MNNSIRMKALLTLVALTGSSSLAIASDYTFSSSKVTIDSVYYRLDETHSVAQYSGHRNQENKTEAVIPSSITYAGKTFTVVSIQGYSFSGGKYNNIVLPNTITEFEERAIYGCPYLERLEIPQGVKVLPGDLFSYCHAFSEVVIPNSVDSVGYDAFYDCPLLEELRFGNPALKLYPNSRPFSSSLDRLYLSNVTPPAVNYSLDNTLVYVPQGSIHSYMLDEHWKNAYIVDGEQGKKVTVHVSTPGTLAAQILTQAEHLSDVNHLVISGKPGQTHLMKQVS